MVSKLPSRSYSRALIAIALAIFTIEGGPARATDTTWTSNSSGSWLTASNWSNGEPNSAAFDVYIDDGDSAVTVTLNNAARTVGSLSIGSDDTLAIQSLNNPATNGYLTVANGIYNAGTLVLNANGNDIVTFDVTGGVFNNVAGAHFNATSPFVTNHFIFRGDMINHGTVDLAHSMTFNKGSGASYANYGTFRVGESLSVFGGTFDQYDGVLQVEDEGNFSALTTTVVLNLRGGEMQVGGNILLSNGSIEGAFNHIGGVLNYTNGAFNNGSYNFLGGTVIGAPRIKSSSFVIGPDATSPASFILEDDNTFAGNVHAGQQITVKNTSTFANGLTSANGIVNNGSILVAAANTGGVRFEIISGTLTNSATGLLHFQTGGSGFRNFRANLVNEGTVTVDESMSFSKLDATYTNNNLFTIADNKTLSVSGTFEQAAGTLDIVGAFTQSSGAFRYLGGTINGTPSINNSALHIGATAVNPATFTIENTALTLENGTLAAGMSVTVTRNQLTSATGFINDGTLTVTGRSGSSGSGITITSGALTNGPSGLLQFLPNFPGTRTLNGNLVNNGTVNVSSATTFSSPSGAYVNNGQFSIAATRTLTINSGGTFEQAGGNLNIFGLLNLQSGTTFRYTGGNISGSVVINNATLDIDGGTSAASFTMAGASTLSVGASGIAAGQVVTLLNEFSTTLNVTAPTGFSNAGTINLTGTTNGITRLSVTSGAVVNNTNGIIRFQTGGNGARSFVGDLTNNGGTVLVDHATTFSKAGGIFEQAAGTTTINANKTLTFSGGSQLKLSGGSLDLKGMIAGAATTMSGGTLDYTAGGSFSGGSFTFLAGTMDGVPLLFNTDLTVGTSATSAFMVRMAGTSDLTLADNRLHAGQKLILTDSFSPNTVVVSPNGFTNDGTIEFDTEAFGDARLSITNGTLVNAAGGIVRSEGFIIGELRADVVNLGTFEINGRLEFTKQNSVFSNQGQVIVPGALTRSVFTANYEQTAGLTHVNGTLDFSSPLRFLGGRLAGSGLVAGLVENTAASVEPGDGIGKLRVFGGYTQQNDGELEIELAGAQAGQFDLLEVTNGAATLGGTLKVQLADLGGGTFIPQAGDVFQVLTATGGVVNRFDHLELPDLESDLIWNVNYSANAVSLIVSIPGDFNFDSVVDAADFVAWRKNTLDPVAYNSWRENFGESLSGSGGTEGSQHVGVPEPAFLIIAIAAVITISLTRRRIRSS